jgi:hypothetical protein
VCVRERERERESVCVCVYTHMHTYTLCILHMSVCVYVYIYYNSNLSRCSAREKALSRLRFKHSISRPCNVYSHNKYQLSVDSVPMRIECVLWYPGKLREVEEV